MPDYNQLVTDIEQWLVGHDVNAVASRLIQLAEDRHANDIHVRAMTKRSIASGNDTRYLALPNDYIDMRRLWYLGNPPTAMIQVSPEGLAESKDFYGASRPTHYAVHEELEFNVPLSSATSVEMVFWSRFPRLSTTNLTNWLVENAYGCYLYGALAEAAPYIVDDPRMSIWEARYAAHVEALQVRDMRSRTGGSPRVSVAGVNP